MRKIFALLIILVLVSVGIFGFTRYRQSNVLVEEADQLLKEGKTTLAIGVYEKAKAAFPLRSDIDQSINGAKLVQLSDTNYKQFTEVDLEIENAEIQAVPDITNIPIIPLKPNQILVPILMYHHIRINPKPNDSLWASLNVSPSQLEAQFQYLNSHDYHTITLGQMLDALNNKAILPKNPIVLSFDDGYRNFYENAYPLLKKYNLKAIQFVITDVQNYPAYLTWNQIIEMDKSGLVEFGAHTKHHPNLPDLSQAAIIDEVKGSKKDIESHLKKPTNWFAYPYGSYNNFILKAVKDAGYLGAASTIYGSVQESNKLFLMPRIMVDGRFSLMDFTKRIS